MMTDEEKDKMLAQLISTPEEREQTLRNYQYGEAVFDISMDPYNHMIRLVFSRWKPFLLRAIAIDEETYFSRFFKQLPITQKVLSQNLKEMQEDGLISRTVLPEVPPRVVYRLTPTGKSLVGLLDLVYDWGWNDMKSKGLPVDILGEMWHGYREPDHALMDRPFYTGTKE
ncbi:MAG: winged helix-turn-helix transcriptional regulator [Oscillospiraceae bacterium]